MRITEHGFAVIEDDTHIGKWAEESGRLDHDQNMLPLVLQHIKEGDIVVDAGAYIGDHTIAYAEAVGIDGQVYAYEPLKEAFECLEYNTAFYDHTILCNAGLGAVDKSLAAVCENENFGMAYLKEGSGINVVTLDGLGLPRLDFMKIDVEGMELEVLIGAKETIARCRPKLLIEINEATLERKGITPADIYFYLEGIGYTFRNIYPGQTLFEPQLDIICIPK